MILFLVWLFFSSVWVWCRLVVLMWLKCLLMVVFNMFLLISLVICFSSWCCLIMLLVWNIEWVYMNF